ncbi:MAG: helix-turn-helix domain-containing protein [Clostridia bacterium]|nr:helix-turn-helix domain-containing protein [Clostridia bacterium]
MTLGEKIRHRRKQLGMTQADLSGEYITRNMISRLETGDIGPSLDTLRYLADRLSVPAGYFLTEEDDLTAFLRPAATKEARALMESGKWNDAYELFARNGMDGDKTDNECAMLLCDCAVHIGQNAYAAGDTTGANLWFDRALSYAEMTSYHTEVPLGTALLYKALLAEMTGETPVPYLETYVSSLGRAVDVERYLLLRFFYDMEHGDTDRAARAASILEIENPLYKTLIPVWQKAAAGESAAARELLMRVFSEEMRPYVENDPILAYRCVKKMEQLSAALDDYKTAYEYAAKRAQLEKRYHIQ